MAKRAYHVMVDNIHGGWDVRENQQPEPHHHFKTKDEAIAYAQKVSLDEEADLIVYNEQGEVMWNVLQSDSGVELDVWNESETLPADVAKRMAEKPDLKGIPQGQIQPKHEP